MSPLFPGKTILKCGIYPKLPQPANEAFVVDRQAWEEPMKGCTQYKTKLLGETL